MPGNPTASPVPTWAGKALATFPSVPLPPLRVSPIAAGPLTVGGSSPPAAPQGCRSHRSGLYFCSPCPPSHSLGTHTAGGGLCGQRIRPGISAGSQGPSGQGKPWPYSLLILCPPNGAPLSPSRRGIPSPPPPTPKGHRSHPTSTSPPPSLPPKPHVLRVAGVPPIPLGVRCPLRCLWSPTGAW